MSSFRPERFPGWYFVTLELLQLLKFRPHAARTPRFIDRSFSTAFGIIWRACATSVSELKRLKENRKLPRARSFEYPIAFRTCDGSREPAVHAEPAEQQMPFWSRSINIPSESIPSTARLEVFGSRCARWPLTCTDDIVSRRPCSKRSRSALTRLFSSWRAPKA